MLFKLIISPTDAFVLQLLRVTHIIHNAWPVNFNRHVTSFESHIAGLVNLLRLCILSSQNYLYPTRLIFASSVAVVGRYPVLHPNGPYEVPETPLGAVYTAQFGYPEGKWVCERLIQIADHLYGMEGLKLMRGSAVRIGQMTGAEGCGAWNESEHFPIIIHTSKIMGALPVIEGVSVSVIFVVSRVFLTFGSVAFLDARQPRRKRDRGPVVLGAFPPDVSLGESFSTVMARRHGGLFFSPRSASHIAQRVVSESAAAWRWHASVQDHALSRAGLCADGFW